MSFFKVRNISSDNTLESSLYNVRNNLISTKVLTEADGINYQVSNNTFYTTNFAANFDWSALGNGLTGTGASQSSNTKSIAIDSKGNIYIGADLITFDGVNMNGIVRWDGSNWYPLGNGLDGTCYSIAIDSKDNVYVGGTFTSLGGTGGLTVNNIAKWSPSINSWSALTGTSGIGLNNTCLSIAIDSNDNVYAGGVFTSAGGISNTVRIAKWSPSTSVWSALTTGVVGPTVCKSIAIDSNDNVYIGGQFGGAGGVTANNIAKWNGYNWYPLGTGLNDVCNSIAIDSNDNVYAGGVFTSTFGGTPGTLNRIAKWSPSIGVWSALGTGLNAGCTTIAVDSNDNVYAGGSFTDISGAGGLIVNNIAKWSPSTSVWSALGDGLNGSCNSIAIDSNDNVYSIGNFTSTQGGPPNALFRAGYYSNQTYINLVYNSQKLKTIRGPADSALVFINSNTNKAFNIDINYLL